MTEKKSLKTFAEKIKSIFTARKKKQENEKKRSIPKLILKIFLWCFGSIIALFLLLWAFINPFLKFSITTVGSGVTGLDITLDNIELSLAHGTFKIINLKVSNPEKFDAPSMLELGTFYTSWKNSSLLTKKIIIHNIEVRNLLVTAEVNESGKLNFLALAEKFVPADKKEIDKPDEPEIRKAKSTTPPPEVWIEKFSLENFDFNWLDKRKEFSIHGFGASLEKIAGSLTNGTVTIQNFRVDNPQNYNIDKLLKIDGINIELDPQTLYSQAPVIKNVEISGLTACAEFSTDGDFNVLALVDSMQNIFPAQEESADQPPKTAQVENNTAAADENEEEVQPQAELKAFKLSSSWFHLEDDRLRIPVKVPLFYAMSDFQFFEDSDFDILPFLHKQALLLRDTCAGVTNADQLAVNFVKTTAESGIRLFKSAGGAIVDGAGAVGGAIVDGAGSAGKALLDGSSKIIQGTNESGKKVFNKLLDTFR